MDGRFRGTLLAGLCCLTAANGAVAETDFSGTVEALLRADDDGTFMNQQLRLDAEVTFSAEDAASLGFSDEESESEGGRSPQARARFWAISDPADEGIERDTVEFHTGGVTVFPFENSSVFLGRDYVIWGRADKVNPVDVVNGEDFTQFLVQDQQRRKLPNTLVNYTYAREDTKFELIYAPRYEGNLLPIRGTRWCQYRCEIASPVNGNQAGFDVTVTDTLGANDVDSGEMSARFTSRAGRYDYGLVAQSGFDKFPVYSRTFTGLTSLTLNRELERREKVGGDVAFTVGEFGIRAEALYQIDSVLHYLVETPEFATDDDGLKDVDQLNWIVGVDWRSSGDLYINVQYAQNKFLDVPEEKFFRSSFETLATFQISDLFLDNDLELKLTVFYETADDSHAVSPEAGYRLSDEARWVTGIYYFEGNEQTFFGEHEDNTNVFTYLEYIF